MLPSDAQLIGAQLTPAFRRLFSGEHDATNADAIRNAAAEAMNLALSEVIGDWNRRHAVIQLSPEVLSLCFGFLPLVDRFAVAAVSKVWRGAALAPDVWSDICVNLGMDNVLPMLERALSLSAQCPVDFRLDFSPRFSYLLLMALERALAVHMHHVRSISWYGALHIQTYITPAPLLQSFKVGALETPITAEFLGGRAGSLRTLVVPLLYLPRSSPALSTLTHLSATTTAHPVQMDVFDILFRTCPKLATLALRGVGRLHMVPDCPAPCTLIDLALETADRLCDLVPYQQAMQREDNLTTVRLSHMNNARRLDLAGFLHGVVELTLLAMLEKDIVDVRCLFSGDRRRRLIAHNMVMFHLQADVRAFPPVFAQSEICFARLEKVCIPISILQVFVRDVPTALPSLREMRIMVQRKMVILEEMDIERARAFPWHLLSSLGLLNFETHPGSARPVEIVIDAGAERLSLSDVDALLDRLAEISKSAGRDGSRRLQFTVRGISADDACAAKDLADERGVSVEISSGCCSA